MAAGCTGGGCPVTNLTAPLVAQGTISSLLLVGLIWAGVGILGLAILLAILAVLLGLCALLTCVTECPTCTCEDSGGGGTCCGPCDPCEGCGDCCGDGGGGGGSGGGGCCGGGGGGSGGGGGGGGGTGEVSAGGWVLPGAAAASAFMLRGRRVNLAHHPDLPQYRADVYHVGGHRLCIGCFTTFPLFVVAAGSLFLVQPAIPWGLALGIGSLLASAQAASAAGLTTTRSRKASVKAALGLGLALYVYGVLTSPFSGSGQFALLGAALLLAMLSTVPRRRRMERERLLRA